MKGTIVEGTIQRLFEGGIRSYVKCVNVDFTSAREETYYDIQVPWTNPCVLGCGAVWCRARVPCRPLHVTPSLRHPLQCSRAGPMRDSRHACTVCPGRTIWNIQWFTSQHIRNV